MAGDGARIFAVKGQRTETYLAAVEALRALAAEGGSPMSAYAEAVSGDRFEQYGRSTGTHPSGAHPCAVRLAASGRCRGQGYGGGAAWCSPPHADHSSLWLKDGKAAVLTSQPYGLSWEGLAATVDFCRLHGLEASVSGGKSWHFPGWTLLVEFVRTSTPGGGPRA